MYSKKIIKSILYLESRIVKDAIIIHLKWK